MRLVFSHAAPAASAPAASVAATARHARGPLLLALLLVASLLAPVAAERATASESRTGEASEAGRASATGLEGSVWEAGGAGVESEPPGFHAQTIPCDGTQSMGILQDNVPWDSAPGQDPLGANVTEAWLLDELFCVLPSSGLGQVDLGQFSLLVISSAQTQAFYDNLFPGGTVHPEVTAWVEAGGTLVAHLTDSASGPGDGGTWAGRTFVGGLTQVQQTEGDNGILEPAHPVVAATAACPSGNCGALEDTATYQDLDGWNASSHGYFTNLPPGTVSILGGPGAARPVYVEYPHGQGTVLATMTTIEWRYVGGFDSVPQNKKLLANEFAYALAAGSPITLSPGSASAPAVAGRWHRVTATVVDPETGAPEPGVDVEFSVASGPSAGTVGRCGPGGFPQFPVEDNVCRTGADGRATWLYHYDHPSGALLGTDEIVAALGPIPAPAATATQVWLELVDYGALGDSYSSGLGARPYFTAVPDCNRSRNAYAVLATPPGYRVPVFAHNLATEGEVGWRFVACQGATTAEVLTDTQFGEPPQVDRVDTDVNFMTLTVAGNDVGFSSILFGCARRACLDREWDDGQTLREWLPEKIESMGPVLVDLYEELLSASGDAPMFVLGYPQLFPATEDEQGCFKLRPWREEMDFFRDMGELLDTALAGAAAEAGVHFVSVTDHFAGHEVCGEDGEWMRGPSVHGSFHPDVDGQAQYALALNTAMANLVTAGAPTEPTGLPANPSAGGLAAATQGAAGTQGAGEPATLGGGGEPELLPSVGPLEVERLEAAPAEACPDVVRPGTGVRLTGGGFEPSSQVTLTADHDGQFVQLGTTTAGSDGRVDAVVTVPAGFDPPAVSDRTDLWQTETVVGFEGLGTGADGAQRLLIGVSALSHTYVLCDVTPPAVDLVSPQDGAVYAVDEEVEAEYSCADEPGGSGVVSCLGDLPSGAPVDTSHPGEYRFTVVAVDAHDNATEVTVTYTVELPAAGPAGFAATCFSEAPKHPFVHGVNTAWSALDGATGYNLYHQEVDASGDPSGEPVLRWSGSGTSRRDPLLQQSTTFDYWVTAVGPGGAESGPSNVVRVESASASGCPPAPS